MNVTMRVDRVHCRPWGLQGGEAGMGNRVTLTLDGKEHADLPNAKVIARALKRGDSFTMLSGGGGGFGPPHERDPERVAHDVRQGYVSRQVAREVYGVELIEDGDVDLAATAKLRVRAA
jgi:N-methylhydantoinase B